MLSAQGPLLGAALAMWRPAIKAWVYIDGLNLYYGAVKDTPYRWLDIVKLSKSLLPAGHSVARVKYFTARVSGVADPDAPRRQRVYLNALRTLPEVETHFGHFLSKNIWRPLTNLPVAGETIGSTPPVVLPAGTHVVYSARPQRLVVGDYGTRPKKRRRKLVSPFPDAVKVEVFTNEEKGSDVNLAVHLLNDAWKNRFDVAMVISNDTDMVTPIRMVAVERGKSVFVVCPGKWKMSPPLEKVATYKRHIRPTHLQRAQLPDPIPGTAIRKPASW